MAETCPTCGHTPDPSPADWLTPEDAALAGFLEAGYADDRGLLEAAVTAARGTPAWQSAVRMADHVTALQGVVRGFCWTQEPAVRAVHRRSLLVLVQAFEGRPGFDPDWLVELGVRS